MGNYASKRKKVGYSELRESIPGSLVSDHDFNLFYSLCRIESARTISTLLHPSSTQLFFVVISGEVEVHLTNTELKNRPILATVFRPGEVIHFFNIPLKSNSVVANIATFEMGECLQNGNIKMSLHFSNGLNSTARVIGMDRTGLNEFLITAQNNTHALRSFLELTVSELPTKSPFFKTITPDQMAILGPLIKVRLSHVGSVISPYTTEMAIQCQRIGTELSPKSRKEPSAANYGPAGEVALLFSGSALSVPFERNLAHITQKLLEQNATHQQHNTLVHRTSSLLPINRLYPATKSSGLSSLPPPIFYPTPPPQPQPGDSDKSSTNAADRARIQVTILPGTFMGLSEFYCRDPRVVPRACLASAPSVVGYLDLNALDSLFSVDPRFERVIKRNYHMLVMSWLKPTVPLLRDMDEWSFALLSCKVFIRCYLADANIYRKGDPSDFAYIMLCGSVKEVTDSGSPKNATPTASSGKLKSVQIERIMNWGTLFGEVALATNNPYFNTTTTQEPTMVLCISKHVLEQIYNNNKTKLCEIRIRLLGGDAALQHVVDHPRGCQLFQAYLDKEMAGENLRFYTAVDRYDAMCKEVVKQYNAVQKLRTENAELLKDLLTITPTESVPQDAASRHSYAVDQDPTLTQDKKLMGGLTLLSPHSAPDRPNRIRNNVNNGDNGDSKHNCISENVNDGIADEGMEQNRRNSAEQATDNNHPVPADTDPCHSEDNLYHNNAMGMHLHRSATNSTTVSTSHHTVDDTVPAIAHSLLSHLPASVPNSTQSSFAMSSTKTSVSDKSMIHYMTGGYQYDSAFNTKHSSIDMTNFGNEQDVPEERTPEQENSSNKDSVMSYGSMRSADSNKSDHFILSVTPNAHLDANNKHSLNSSGGANSALTHNNLHGVASQNHHNNHTHHHNTHHKGVVVKRPVLESIISESNFSVMSSEPDEDGSTKFSLKVKPTPQGSISAAAYSSKIAPLIENEDENEPDNDEIHDGARAGGSASPFTIASIRKAMQYAASVVVEGSSAINSARREDTYGLSPRRTDSINNNNNQNNNNNNKHAVSPKHSLTLGTLPALPPSQYDTPAVVKDASSVNSGGSQQDAASVVVPERVADPEKAKEVARNITQKLHRIQKNIVELKQVARSIMQTYIYNGSEMQLNLPDALRMRTEKSFKVWSANLMASVTVDSWDDREARRSEVSIKVPVITEETVIPANTQKAVVDSVPPNITTNHASKPVYNKFGSMAFLESIIPGGLQIVIKSTDSADTGASDAPRVIAQEQSDLHPHSTSANQQNVPQLTNKTDNYIINNNLRTPFSGAGISGTTTTASSSVSSNPFTPLQLRINTDVTRSVSDFPLQNLNSDSADTMDTGLGSIQIQPTPLQYPNAITKPKEIANANTNANTNSTSSYHITVPKQIRPLNAPTIANSGPLPTQLNNAATTDAAQQLHFDADMNIDLSFIDLFKEPKAEILRLLRDDKFPRFKNTNQFASFIANVKPYEKESFFDQSLIKSGHNDRYSLDFDLSR